MKRSLLAVALCALAASCTASGKNVNDHWSESSVAPRMARFWLGYDGLRDGSYGDFAWERKEDNRLTLTRHFLNHNPDNPFQSEQGARKPRPKNWSIAPNPIPYIHLEGLIVGLIPYAAGSGYFVLPIDSIITTLDEPDGIDQFVYGFEELFSGVVGGNAAEDEETMYVTAIDGQVQGG